MVRAREAARTAAGELTHDRRATVLTHVVERGERTVRLQPRVEQERVGAIETRQKMADIYLDQGARKQYVFQLKQIVAGDAVAGNGRTDRTKYLAAKASLVGAKTVKGPSP